MRMQDVDASELGADGIDAVAHRLLVRHVDDPAARVSSGCPQLARGVVHTVV